jgi:hypothetical protein
MTETVVVPLTGVAFGPWTRISGGVCDAALPVELLLKPANTDHPRRPEHAAARCRSGCP